MKNSIKELRKKHLWSQEALAQKLGVSRQTIISIEKGKYHPSLPLAIQLARCFHTTVEEVFHLDGKEETK